MKGFYALLAVVAVVGAGALWYGSRPRPAPLQSAPPPVAAADGFRGYTLGSDAARVEVIEYSDFECPFCASFATVRSEEHTSELQSRLHLVCRLLLEKKKKK